MAGSVKGNSGKRKRSDDDVRDYKIAGRELPYNMDAEEGVLASIILDGGNEVINSCLALKIRDEYFFIPQHQVMFAAMVELFNQGKPIDEIVLAEYLSSSNKLEDVGGVAAIARIAGRIETYAHYRQWVEILREKYFLRTLIHSCAQIIEDAYANRGDIDSFIARVEEKVLGISQDKVGDSVKKASLQVEGAVQLINQQIMSKGQLTGVPTGFTELDALMRGLHANEMIVIAGRPGTGKTSIALNIAESALFSKNPIPTLIFSLEMMAENLYQRMIASRARIDQRDLSRGFVSKDSIADINATAKELKGVPLWIDDTSNINILEMRAKARRLNQQIGGKLGLVIVDYLQLLNGMDSSVPREQQVAEISRGMKAMAKELKVPVIVLAQLNRESEKETRNPRPSDLRESGAIEQDADAILLLSPKRKADTDGETISSSQWLIRVELAKNRNGPTGIATLLFNRSYTRYENYTQREDANI